jgi:hypothetical protein
VAWYCRVRVRVRVASPDLSHPDSAEIGGMAIDHPDSHGILFCWE